MAITTMDGFISAIASAPNQPIFKASQTAEGAGTWHSMLKAAGFPVAMASATNPATGVGECPTRTAAFAFPINNPTGGNKLYIGRVEVVGSTIGGLVIYDRLWQNSGLSGATTGTPAAINSAALTRYTDGLDVEIWGEIYSAIGATGATLSVVYTDATNLSRTATYTHPANAESVGQMFPLVPPADAKGCKSIQNYVWNVTTGTAGNFGLVMLRRLCVIPMMIANVPTILDGFQIGLPEVQSDACLSLMVQCSATNTGVIIGSIDVVEG